MEAPGTKLTENFAAKGKRDWLLKNVSHILEPSWRNTRNISDSFVHSPTSRHHTQHRNIRRFWIYFAIQMENRIKLFIAYSKRFAPLVAKIIGVLLCIYEKYACINSKHSMNNAVLFT